MDTVTVDLGDRRSYPIYIGRGLLDTDGALLRSHVKGKSVLVVTNDKVAPLYLEKVLQVLKADGHLNVHSLVLPDGEQHKNMDTLGVVTDRALELSLDRQSTFVALGGGVIGDLVGFAAAIYQRGVNFIQVPTTVMAAVDSSVGGKTGVNHRLGKNMVGSFHQPQCVFVDTKTLDTLPDRELASGISEIMKYGLVRDAPFFDWLEGAIPALLSRDADALRTAIRRSCENKAAVVAADEREKGDEKAAGRAALNLGHTFGHAVENGCGYGAWLHGEAVAVGIAMAADMSHRMGWIEGGLKDRIGRALKAAKLPTRLPAGSPMTLEKFQTLMSVDKKVANGVLRLILLKGELGNCVFTDKFDKSAMVETIKEYC